MQKHLLTDGTKEVILGPYPENWDELNKKQAKYAGNLMFLLLSEQLQVDQFRKLMVDIFIGRDNRGMDKLSIEQSMDMWANESVLADTVNFFFTVEEVEEKGQKNERYELNPTGIVNHFPIIRHRLRTYKGPGDFLAGFSFVQFKDALMCTQKYLETREEEWLTRLVATCYTEKGQPYKMADVDQRAKRLEKLNRGIKFMTFCYVSGCMHNLKTDGGGEGIEIDGNLCRFSLLFKKEEYSGVDDGIGLLGVLMTLAESGVFGDIKATAETDVWDVLARLYQLKVDAMEMERQLKQKR